MEKVSFITILGTLVLMLPVLTVPGSVVHPGVPVPAPDEDGGPQLPHVQVRRRRMLNKRMMYCHVQVLRGRHPLRHHGQLHLQIPPRVGAVDSVQLLCCVEIALAICSHGHFYTIPTKSEVVADGQNGLWLTQFKGGKQCGMTS